MRGTFESCGVVVRKKVALNQVLSAPSAPNPNESLVQAKRPEPYRSRNLRVEKFLLASKLPLGRRLSVGRLRVRIASRSRFLRPLARSRGGPSRLRDGCHTHTLAAGVCRGGAGRRQALIARGPPLGLQRSGFQLFPGYGTLAAQMVGGYGPDRPSPVSGRLGLSAGGGYGLEVVGPYHTPQKVQTLGGGGGAKGGVAQWPKAFSTGRSRCRPAAVEGPRH